jgi:hypothetical protein
MEASSKERTAEKEKDETGQHHRQRRIHVLSRETESGWMIGSKQPAGNTWLDKVDIVHETHVKYDVERPIT